MIDSLRGEIKTGFISLPSTFNIKMPNEKLILDFELDETLLLVQEIIDPSGKVDLGALEVWFLGEISI